MKSRKAPGRAAGTRRGTGELEQLLAAGSAAWWLRATATRRGGAGKASRGRASGER
jgi:hypothetical protein